MPKFQFKRHYTRRLGKTKANWTSQHKKNLLHRGYANMYKGKITAFKARYGNAPLNYKKTAVKRIFGAYRNFKQRRINYKQKSSEFMAARRLGISKLPNKGFISRYF